ncbi:hypothetical protein J6590_088050 [Homalodisca vitripennis]|nr:hypothetical protein J6590_088050 [Homalodisca vitripennis]
MPLFDIVLKSSGPRGYALRTMPLPIVFASRRFQWDCFGSRGIDPGQSFLIRRLISFDGPSRVLFVRELRTWTGDPHSGVRNIGELRGYGSAVYCPLDDHSSDFIVCPASCSPLPSGRLGYHTASRRGAVIASSSRSSSPRVATPGITSSQRCRAQGSNTYKVPRGRSTIVSDVVFTSGRRLSGFLSGVAEAAVPQIQVRSRTVQAPDSNG